MKELFVACIFGFVFATPLLADKWNHDTGKLSSPYFHVGERHANSAHYHARGHHRVRERNGIPVDNKPFFDPTSPTEVRAQLGSHAYLPCRIRNLGDKSVSWIRKRDSHILSVDRYMFIADDRFVTWFEPSEESWTLQLKFVSQEDAGRYECQISMEPKMSHVVRLDVITPKVELPEGEELHVRSGSRVNLKCVISQALHPPSVVFWYHENIRVIEGTLAGVVQAPLELASPSTAISRLIILKAAPIHAGNYTCAPAGLKASSVLLHVLNGEHPAAMQHSAGTVVAPPSFGCAFVFAVFFLSSLLRLEVFFR